MFNLNRKVVYTIMRLADVQIGDILFEDEDWPFLGGKCLVNIGPKQYVVGILHSYTTDEYCFKECLFYQDCGEGIVPWTTHSYKPIHWTYKHECMWAKWTKIEPK